MPGRLLLLLVLTGCDAVRGWAADWWLFAEPVDTGDSGDTARPVHGTSPQRDMRWEDRDQGC